MAVYTLPELPYDYSALEPNISGKIMELHHDKHHATYVKGANTALEQLEAARESGDFANINKLEKDLAFNLAGHANHTVFWENLTPETQRPEGELDAAITENFGSFEKFQGQFAAAALGIQGSGWAALTYDSLSEKLLVEQWHDHQSEHATGTVPLFLVDMWEHAFYLDYLNVKADYVKAIWNIANWQDVAARLETARAAGKGLIAR